MDIKVGDKVRIIAINQIGEVIKPTKPGDNSVQVKLPSGSLVWYEGPEYHKVFKS